MRIDLLATRKKRRRFATAVLAQLVLSFLFPLAASALTQNAYRWRNDDGTEAGATYAAAENAALSSAPVDVTKRLRFGLANGGAESEFVRLASIRLNLGFDQYNASVIDTAAGFAYFATNTAPIRIVKVKLSDFTKVAHIDLPAGNDFVAGNSGVIDAAGDFAYFATSTKPSKIIKIRLSDFTHASTITLASGEEGARNGAINAGFLYYALTGPSSTDSKVVKISLATFLPVATLTFAAGESGATSLIMDATNGFLYVSLSSGSSRIIKVRLSDFTELAVLTTTGVRIQTGAIDVAGGFAYFSTNEFPGKVIKVNLATFTQAGSLTLAADDTSPTCANADTAAGFVYFCISSANNPRIAKVSIASFTQVGSLALPAGESPRTAVIDSANSRLYTGTLTSPGKILRINLSTFAKIDDITLETGENTTRVTVMDKGNGFIYYALAGNPGKIVKVRMSDFTKVGVLVLSSGNDDLRTGFMDTAAGFAYYGTGTSPARIVKIDLATFTETATLTLASADGTIVGSAIDASGPTHFGYFTTSVTPAGPGKVVKINLSTFTTASILTFSSGFSAQAAAIDTAGGFAYFSRTNNPGGLTKVRLSDFVELQTATFASGENNGLTLDLDLVNGFGYSGTNTFPGKIAKVRLSDMVYIGSLTLGTGEDSPFSSAFDAANGFIYYSTAGNPMIVAKVSTATFTETAALTYASPENSGRGLIIDTQGGHLYMGSSTSPTYVIKTSLAPKSQLRLEYGLKSTTCAAIGSWTQVPVTPSAGEHWQMSGSTSVLDGAATTNPAGLTDGNTSFQPGVVKTTSSSQTSEISLGEKQFTELEYAVRPTDAASIGQAYCFRLTNAGSTTGFTFSQYAEASVSTKPTSAAGGCSFLIRPNGGERLVFGGSYEITWSRSSCQVDKVRLSLSTDSGASYSTVIADKEPDDGSYSWTVPNISTTTAKVKIEAFSDSSLQGTDASDSDFLISSTSTGTTPPTAIPYNPAEEQAKAVSLDQDQGWTETSGPKPCVGGTAFKSVSSKAVYYCGSDGKKHVFPNEKTYKTWFADFSSVITLPDEAVASIPEGKTITYKPGVKMVKVTTDAKVYAVSAGGALHWVTTEGAAAQLYGTDWNKKIDDLDGSFFDDYTIAGPI